MSAISNLPRRRPGTRSELDMNSRRLTRHLVGDGKHSGRDVEAECAFIPAVLELVGLTGASVRPRGLWHLSKVLCRNPRRTTHKSVAGGNSPLGTRPRRANAGRVWSPREAPTNGPAVAAQSPSPAAVQPPLHLSCPALRGSRPAGDTVQLRKTSRLICLL